MLRSRKTIVSVAIVAIVGIVAALGFAAWSVGTTLAAPLLQATASPTAPGQTGTVSQYATFFLQHFATHLGLSVDQVKSAYQSAYGETIDQMVKDGRLTQTEGDQLKQKVGQDVTNGTLPMFAPGFRGKGFGGFGPGFGMRGGHMELEVATIAKSLGVTEQDLITELQSGKSISDIAKEKNVDINKVKQDVIAAYKANLDTAVKNNRITQAQADTMLQNFTTRLDTLVTQTNLFQNFHGKGWNWNNNQPNTPPNTSPTPSGTSGVGL